MSGITREESKECVGKGWSKLLDSIYDNLEEDTYVLQVKEKFGGLRFYIASGDDFIFDVIEKAENDSYKICEDCGKPGELREELSWIRTLCDDCFSNI